MQISEGRNQQPHNIQTSNLIQLIARVQLIRREGKEMLVTMWITQDTVLTQLSTFSSILAFIITERLSVNWRYSWSEQLYSSAPSSLEGLECSKPTPTTGTFMVSLFSWCYFSGYWENRHRDQEVSRPQQNWEKRSGTDGDSHEAKVTAAQVFWEFPCRAMVSAVCSEERDGLKEADPMHFWGRHSPAETTCVHLTQRWARAQEAVPGAGGTSQG